MQLKHLLSSGCPFCGRPTKAISIDGTHCNRQQFETRVYDCGYKVRFVPNFGKEEVVERCPKDPTDIVEKALYTKEKLRMRRFISRLKSTRLVERLKSDLSWTLDYHNDEPPKFW